MASDFEDIREEVQEYNELLKQLGIEDGDSLGHKNRVHRRFNFDPSENSILLQTGDEMSALVDVSVGGLSFISRHEYEPGMMVGLNFNDRYFVNVEIVFVHREGTESDGKPLFRNGAEFSSRKDGFKCTIAVLKYSMEIK